MQINSGNLDLDSFLKGGYEKLTTFYGLPTSGKTCLSLMAVLEQIKENKVFFLDVKNDFNLVRLEQINGSKIDDYLNNLFVLQIKSFADQQKKINSLSKLIEKKEFSLIVIDGFNFYYRTLVNSKPDLAKGMLNSQLKILKEISKKATVIITNDVFESFDTGDIKMIG